MEVSWLLAITAMEMDSTGPDPCLEQLLETRI